MKSSFFNYIWLKWAKSVPKTFGIAQREEEDFREREIV